MAEDTKTSIEELKAELKELKQVLKKYIPELCTKEEIEALKKEELEYACLNAPANFHGPREEQYICLYLQTHPELLWKRIEKYGGRQEELFYYIFSNNEMTLEYAEQIFKHLIKHNGNIKHAMCVIEKELGSDYYKNTTAEELYKLGARMMTEAGLEVPEKESRTLKSYETSNESD